MLNLMGHILGTAGSRLGGQPGSGRRADEGDGWGAGGGSERGAKPVWMGLNPDAVGLNPSRKRPQRDGSSFWETFRFNLNVVRRLGQTSRLLWSTLELGLEAVGFRPVVFFYTHCHSRCSPNHLGTYGSAPEILMFYAFAFFLDLLGQLYGITGVRGLPKNLPGVRGSAVIGYDHISARGHPIQVKHNIS